MKKYIVLLALLCVALVSKAQFTISYSAGYGDYKMDKMQTFMDEALSALLSQVPSLPYRLVSNFPGNVNHRFDATYLKGPYEFGLTGGYNSTGSKLAYSDYSGKYSQKITANAIRLAALYRYHVPISTSGKRNVFSAYGEFSVGAVFTDFKYDGFIEIGNKRNDFKNFFSNSASGFTLQPMLGVKYNVTQNIAFHLAGGYEFEFGSNIEETITYESNNAYNRQPITTEYRLDWSGFRANAGVSYTFSQ